MGKQKELADPLALAKPRAIEHLAPGCWWQVDYLTEKGDVAQIWAQVRAVYHGTDKTTGTKVVRVVGVDTEGDICDLFQVRGYGISKTLVTAEARRCGLVMPEEKS